MDHLFFGLLKLYKNDVQAYGIFKVNSRYYSKGELRMTPIIQRYFDQLGSSSKDEQYEGFTELIKVTRQQVDWAYEVWDQLVEQLTAANNHTRSRAAQFLAQLAISDPEERMLRDFPKLWAVTFDERFVTARHTLQVIWRVGLAGETQKQIVLDHLQQRFLHCTTEKNYTLIRSDIIECLKHLHIATDDGQIPIIAGTLIAAETDEKYRKKQKAIWNKKVDTAASVD